MTTDKALTIFGLPEISTKTTQPTYLTIKKTEMALRAYALTLAAIDDSDYGALAVVVSAKSYKKTTGQEFKEPSKPRYSKGTDKSTVADESFRKIQYIEEMALYEQYRAYKSHLKASLLKVIEPKHYKTLEDEDTLMAMVTIPEI